MQEPIKDTWADYSKLVLKELERLNEGHERMRTDFDSRFKELNKGLSETQNLSKVVEEHKAWIERVTDVWSTTQMKESKDEIYEQKGRWQSTIAVLVFIQVLITIVLSIWKSLPFSH